MNLICTVPVCAMRSEPAHRSEMVSQLLFGECCAVIAEEHDQWVRVRALYDGYEGWCTLNQFSEVAGREFLHPANNLTGDWVNEVEYIGQPVMVPFGSSLTLIKDGNAAWGVSKLKYSGAAIDLTKNVANAESVRKFSMPFLNTPYLWGGRSVFGIDCSGFVQAVFRFVGIALLRDASQQAGQGLEIPLLADSQLGDLAFFDNDNGRITHVGILFGDQTIIHASGRVRVDAIDQEGIIQSESGRRTHHLCRIRRYF